MPRYDFKSPRLHVDAGLTTDASVVLDRNQANYLLNVLRLTADDTVLLFNGRDGEWRSVLDVTGRKAASLICRECTRPQPEPGDLHYLFAPLKQARLDYMIQKAVEMGASRMTPVLTDYTQVRKLNTERARANAIEAAEQCGILTVPVIDEPVALTKLLDGFPADRTLIFCDEGEESQNPLSALYGVEPGPLSVLIGPEGGFSETERTTLRARENVVPIPLGPRVLRADTAAVAALAIVQALLGDWR